MGTKQTAEILKHISDTPSDRQLTLVATGKYIGEGFYEARLDTLFLTMPISLKGTLQQYAGRLHRLFESKKEAQIYDYVDINVKMLEKMYGRRLNGYASIGYKAKSGNVDTDSIDIMFDNSDFLPVFNNDILAATREILIVSPFVTKRRATLMMQTSGDCNTERYTGDRGNQTGRGLPGNGSNRLAEYFYFHAGYRC